MTEIKPQLYSDFDGTAVAKMYLLDPRNLTKYPLPEVEGYSDFLRGARLPDDTNEGQNGIEIAGVVTKRPNIFIRRLVTARSVAKLGMREFFPDDAKLIHAGSESNKAQFIYERSAEARTGMLEDRPHKLGAELLKTMAAQSATAEGDERYILIGAVNHGKSGEYIDKLVNDVRALYDSAAISEFDYEADEDVTSVGHRIKIGRATLEIVQLAPYSELSGAHFGKHLVGLRQTDAEPEPVSLTERVTLLVKAIGREGQELVEKGRRQVHNARLRAATLGRTFVIRTPSGDKKVTLESGDINAGTEVSIETIPPGV